MVAFSASYRVAAACASPTDTSAVTSSPPASTAPARTSLRWVLRTRVSLGSAWGLHGTGEPRAARRRTVRQIAYRSAMLMRLPKSGQLTEWPARVVHIHPRHPQRGGSGLASIAVRHHSSLMSYAKVLAVGLVGLAGHLVEVEADLAAGLPGLTLTGLPDTALSEARDRVRAALVNSGESWPNRRITVNLLPAALPKHGSVFDLAIACTVLAGAGMLPLAPLGGVVLLGELGLDGTVRPVRGVLPGVLAAVRAGITHAVVPVANAREAALVPGVKVRATDSLRRLIDFIRGSGPLLDVPAVPPLHPATGADLADVVGQDLGRRGLELAAAGGHHLLMVGPPGAGETMLARRLPPSLAPLADAAAMEV